MENTRKMNAALYNSKICLKRISDVCYMYKQGDEIFFLKKHGYGSYNLGIVWDLVVVLNSGNGHRLATFATKDDNHHMYEDRFCEQNKLWTEEDMLDEAKNMISIFYGNHTENKISSHKEFSIYEGQKVTICLKWLFEKLQKDDEVDTIFLEYNGYIRKEVDGGSIWYDLKTENGTPCMDGEMCEILQITQDFVELMECDEKIPFKLSREEFCAAAIPCVL